MPLFDQAAPNPQGYKDITPQQAHASRGQVRIIDVREPDEFNAELINPVTEYMRGQSGMPGKVERATPLLTKLERGEIYFPSANSTWLADLEQEWLAWTGLDDEPADQIDAASYAAGYTHDGYCGVMIIESIVERPRYY